MHSALLENDKVVSAKSYDPHIHGYAIRCIDTHCHAPVIFVSESGEVAAHFKTTGKNDSIHNAACGFAKKLTFQESVSKVQEYQDNLRKHGLREIPVKLNLDKLDPDIPKREAPEEGEKKEKKKQEIDEKLLKDKNETPKSISSLKTIKKLFTSVEPDLLAGIMVRVKGHTIPISQIICTQDLAHKLLWNDESLNVPYFIHGQVSRFIKRDKVWYIVFKGEIFTLVIFEKHFKYFQYKEGDLLDKEILAVGYLKKNDFKDKQLSEMVIKSSDYIEFLN